MSTYNTFTSSGNNKNKNNQESESSPPPPPPLLYNSPLVSSALITAFGRPTLIEYDAPADHSLIDHDNTEFQPLKGQKPSSLHARTQSLPDSHHRRHNTRSFKSSYTTSASIHEDHPTTTSIAAYTYRIKHKLTSSHSNYDQHHLIMCQNPDGTYSHADECGPDGTTNGNDTLNGNGGDKLTTRQSISQTTITALSTTLSTYDDLPAHVHPTVPVEIMHPKYTETAPALKMWPLAVLVFYNVSGGPFGIEPSIRAAGNFYAILGFIVFPFVWALPEALVTAELGAAFQDPSAGVAWVEEAFGETLGGLCGYLGWISGATDNAIYPTLFLEYVTSVSGTKSSISFFHRFLLIAILTIFLSLLNYRGLEIVGNASLIVCIIAMSPFVLMTFIGAPQVVVERWFQMPEVQEDGESLFDDAFQTSAGPLPLLSMAGIMWRPYLNNLFWNLNSFDGAASFAGETTCVRTTYPKGIFVGLIICVVCYIVPLMIAVGATDYSQSEWVDGHLGQVAVDIGGSWLGGWTIFAAGISNLALYEAEMSADSFQLMGMAERGYLPKIFQKRSKYGTPTNGIILGTVIIIVFGCADFGQLLELLNANYAIALLLEYAAFVKLRLYHKDLQRPYRIPIPDWAAVLVAIPPVLGIIVIFLVSNWYVWIFSVGAVAFSLGLHKLGSASKKNGWFTYEAKATYEETSNEDPSTVEGTESSTTANAGENEWDYKNEELGVIQEENKII